MSVQDPEPRNALEQPTGEDAPPPVLGGLVRHADAAWRREPTLVAFGLAGLVVAALCLVGVGVRGPFIPPEGKLLDAAIFTFGVGVFVLAVALLLPLAGFSEPARRRWRRVSYSFLVLSFVLEPVQAMRGIDPRFTEAGGALDMLLGILFGVSAGLFVVFTVAFGLRFFRADVLARRPLLRVGIRYGVAAVWLSFGVGILMSVIGGRLIGDDGNLMLAHGLGVHGIQALPLVALLVAWAGLGDRRARPLVHVVGVAWLAACTASFLQALLQRPPLEPSLLVAASVAGPVVWLIAASAALAAVWGRLVAVPEPAP